MVRNIPCSLFTMLNCFLSVQISEESCQQDSDTSEGNDSKGPIVRD
jgi:hypothetical protein